MLDVVVLLGVHPHHADPAAALDAVGGDRQPLDVAGARDRDDHVLLGDQLLEVDLALGRQDLGAAVVAELLAHLLELLADDGHQPGLVGQDAAQLGDALHQVGVLALDALALEAGQRAQAHVEDGLGLDLGQRELAHQLGPGRVDVVGGADEGDHGVEVVERDQVALEHVRPPLGPIELELRAAGDDLLLVVEVVDEHLPQRERASVATARRIRPPVICTQPFAAARLIVIHLALSL